MRISALSYLLTALLAASVIAHPSQAQLQTVAPTNITQLQGCPSGLGFYTTDPNHPMTCTQLTISCANTLPIVMTYGVANPTAVSRLSRPLFTTNKRTWLKHGREVRRSPAPRAPI